MEDEIKKLFQSLVLQQEGHSEDVYTDSKGIKTIGRGYNLRSPATQNMLSSFGYDPKKVRSGKQDINPEDFDRMDDWMYQHNKDILSTLKTNSFPGAELHPHQEAALMSMIYNAGPKVLGPKMREYLNNNDTTGAAKEILINSMKESQPQNYVEKLKQTTSPGLMRRRFEEAKTFMPDPVLFNQIIKDLDPEEVNRLKTVRDAIKNPNTLKEYQEKYPFLSDDPKIDYEPIKFNKLLKGV